MLNLGAEKVYIGKKNYRKNTLGKKECWYVQVNRKMDIKIILEAISPLLISKKKQADLILSFFKDYPNLLLGRGNRSGKKNDNFEAYNKLIEAIKKEKMVLISP